MKNVSAYLQKDGEILRISAEYTVLASGGIGGRYKHSTNYPQPDGRCDHYWTKAWGAYGNLDYVQIHPTTLYSQKPGRRFLISESVRGEGAVLYNKKRERFVDELLPRDVVSKAIHKQMKEDGTEFVWLSMEHIPQDTIINHFPNIYKDVWKKDMMS